MAKKKKNEEEWNDWGNFKVDNRKYILRRQFIKKGKLIGEQELGVYYSYKKALSELKKAKRGSNDINEDGTWIAHGIVEK